MYPDDRKWPEIVKFSLNHFYAALLPRRGPHNASHSVCPSVCPSVPLWLPSVTSRHLANYNDTRTFRHALRATYRTAISAAQILVSLPDITVQYKITNTQRSHCNLLWNVGVVSHALDDSINCRRLFLPRTNKHVSVAALP